MALESAGHIQPYVVFELNHMALKMAEQWSEITFDSKIRAAFKITISNESNELIVVDENNKLHDQQSKTEKRTHQSIFDSKP